MVEPWIAGLWVALKKEFAARKLTNHDKCASLSGNTISSSDIDSKMKLLKLNYSERKSDLTSKSVANVNSAPSIQDSPPSLSKSTPPLSQSALNVPSLPPEYLKVEFQENSYQVRSPMVKTSPEYFNDL